MSKKFGKHRISLAVNTNYATHVYELRQETSFADYHFLFPMTLQSSMNGQYQTQVRLQQTDGILLNSDNIKI